MNLIHIFIANIIILYFYICLEFIYFFQQQRAPLQIQKCYTYHYIVRWHLILNPQYFQLVQQNHQLLLSATVVGFGPTYLYQLYRWAFHNLPTQQRGHPANWQSVQWLIHHRLYLGHTNKCYKYYWRHAIHKY